MTQPIARPPDLGAHRPPPPWQMEWWRVPFLHEEPEDPTGATISRFELPALPAHKVCVPPERLRRSDTGADPSCERWPRPPLLASRATPWLAALDDLYALPQTYPTSISPQAGLLVHALAANHRPKLVVELGVGHGAGTIWLAAALEPGASLLAIDDFTPLPRQREQDRRRAVADRLAAAELTDRVELLAGHTSHSLKERAHAINDAGGADMVVVDADHTIRGCWHDVWAAERVLDVGGLLVLHDTHPVTAGCEGPRAVMDWLDRLSVGLYQRVELALAPVDMGLAILRRVG